MAFQARMIPPATPTNSLLAKVTTRKQNHLRTLTFFSRPLQLSALKAIYLGINVRQRLILMLALWRNTTGLWSFTTATVGFGAGFVVARIFWPKLRLYIVFLRSELTSVLANRQSTTLRAATLLTTLQNTPLPKTPERQSRRQLDEEREESLTDEELDTMTDESPMPRRMSSKRRTKPRPMSQHLAFDAISYSPTTSNPSHFHEHPSPYRHSKRLSLNFPIQPLPLPSPTLSSYHHSPLLSPELMASPVEPNILTVLAAKERRVLELKEELKRAEEDLAKIKIQWTRQQKTTETQNASRRMIPLQPVATDLTLLDYSDDDLVDGDSHQLLLQKEIDRRKALLTGVRSSGRKVFSGSKHTRALSLLSPDKASPSVSFKTDSLSKGSTGSRSLERTMTTPDFGDSTSADLISASKQMMGDMKETFWTFVGDIKSAAVGSEASNRPASYHSRTKPGRSNRHRSTLSYSAASSRTITPSRNRERSGTMHNESSYKEIASSFWKEHGIVESPRIELRRVPTQQCGISQKADSKAFSKPNDYTPLTSSPGANEDEWAWGTPTSIASAKSKISPVPLLKSIVPPPKPILAPINSTKLKIGRIRSPSSPLSSSASSSSSSSSSSTSTVSNYSDKSNATSTPGRSSPTAIYTTHIAATSNDAWSTLLSKSLTPDGIKRTADGLMADWQRGVQKERVDYKSVKAE